MEPRAINIMDVKHILFLIPWIFDEEKFSVIFTMIYLGHLKCYKKSIDRNRDYFCSKFLVEKISNETFVKQEISVAFI